MGSLDLEEREHNQQVHLSSLHPGGPPVSGVDRKGCEGGEHNGLEQFWSSGT